MAGLVQALGWQSYVEENQPAATILTIPAMTAKETAEYVKSRLGIHFVRTAGDLSATCTRVGLLAGYRGGGALSIPLFEKENLDLIISGEGPEWETPEYVRDAEYQGKNKALIVLGHAESEEPGMKYLAEWMRSIFPAIPVHFIPEKQVFQII
jgi:putative NIF3 family GTP cyclohydrolase 1 type 2